MGMPRIVAWTAPSSLSQATSILDSLRSHGADVWTDTRTGELQTDSAADHELYARPYTLLLLSDFDPVRPEPPHVLRRVFTAQRMNSLRVAVVVLVSGSGEGRQWYRFWNSRTTPTLRVDDPLLLARLRWLFAIETPNDRPPSITSSTTPTEIPSCDDRTRACSLYLAGRYAEALMILRYLTAKSQPPGGSWATLAYTLLALQQWDECLQVSQHAFDVGDGRVMPMYSLGMSLLELGEPEKALGPFGRALDIAPFYGAAWLGRARALSALGRLPEALQALDLALGIKRDNPWAYENDTIFEAERAERDRLLPLLLDT